MNNMDNWQAIGKLKYCQSQIKILTKTIEEVLLNLEHPELDSVLNYGVGREECWSNNIRVNIPIPDESGVGLDNTWSVDKEYIIAQLEEEFLDCDIVFVSCGENREGAVTYNVDIEVCCPFDQSCTVEQNEMAIDHDLEEFCKANNWLIIPKE